MKRDRHTHIYPQICRESCISCGLCIKDCIAHAIDPSDMSVDSDRCIRCSHCSAICPTAAVTWLLPDGETSVGNAIHEIPEGFSSELANVVKRRRSIRHFSGENLSEEMIRKIISVVNHSPTGTNSRGVGITVIRGPVKMREFSDLCMMFFRRLSRTLLNPFSRPFLRLVLGKQMLSKLQSYSRHIERYFEGENNLTHSAPALFLFHADRKSSCPSEDAVIWASNAALYAESLGIGTCFNGFIVRAARYSRTVRRFLDLPSGHRVYETFLAGYSAHSYKREAFHEQAYFRLIRDEEKI